MSSRERLFEKLMTHPKVDKAHSNAPKVTATALHCKTRLDRSFGYREVLQTENLYFRNPGGWPFSRLKKRVAKWFVDQRFPFQAGLELVDCEADHGC